MNRFTLCFKDQFLEKKFQDYQHSNYGLYILQTYRISCVITLAFTILSLIQSNYIQALLCVAVSVLCVYLHNQMKKSRLDMSKAFLIHNIVMIIYPEITLFQCLDSGVSNSTCVSLLLITQIIVQSGIIQQNIILASLQFINMLLASVFTVYWRFGLCEPQYIIFLYIIYWAIQEYQRISINRSNFIASQVNGSIYEIFKNVTMSPVIIFNYDEEHLVFQLEQSFHFQFNLQTLLTKIYISNKNNLSEFIYQNFVKKSVKGFQKYALNGLTKNTKQKIQLELYIQTYPKTKFVIKILDQLPMKYPEELKYEQKLIAHYFNQTMFTERVDELQILQKAQWQLWIRLTLNHMMISYKFSIYQVKRSVIKIFELIQQIADNLKLPIKFTDSQSLDMQLILDRPLTQTLLQSILYMMNIKNNIVECYFNSNQESVYQIIFYSVKTINIQPGFNKTRFYYNMNYLAHQLSFSDLEISEYKIKLDILKISLSKTFL